MNNFSTNLVFIRKEKKFNQKQMADYLSIKPSTYANYETGFSKPELDTFLSISKLLGVGMDDLVNKNLSPSKKYKALPESNKVEDADMTYGEQISPDWHEELLLKIILLNEKLLACIEELRNKDNSILALTEKIKQLEGELK